MLALALVVVWVFGCLGSCTAVTVVSGAGVVGDGVGDGVGCILVVYYDRVLVSVLVMLVLLLVLLWFGVSVTRLCATGVVVVNKLNICVGWARGHPCVLP